MREEVMVLPPSADGRKPSFVLNKTEEAAFNISRKWVAPDSKGVEKVAGVKAEEKREEKGHMPAAERVQTEALKGHERCAAPLHEVERGESPMMKNVAASPVPQTLKEAPQDAPPLQWGNLKRPRGSRRGPKIRDSSDLRETMRVQAASLSTAMVNSSAVALKGTPKPKDLERKRDHPSSFEPAIAQTVLEDGCKRVKTSRGSDSKDVKKRVPVQGGRRSPPQQEHPSHQSKTRTSPDKKVASPEKRAVALDEAGHSKSEFSWPKFILHLCRKEKEDDFVMMKGGKLPQRPKRRPKAAEKALLYCTPGNWLSDMTAARYDVRERKCTRRKSRGLKAMASMDSDSD